MSRRGNCWDNAVAESFLCNVEKGGHLTANHWAQDIAVRGQVFEYVECDCNRTGDIQATGG